MLNKDVINDEARLYPIHSPFKDSCIILLVGSLHTSVWNISFLFLLAILYCIRKTYKNSLNERSCTKGHDRFYELSSYDAISYLVLLVLHVTSRKISRIVWPNLNLSCTFFYFNSVQSLKTLTSAPEHNKQFYPSTESNISSSTSVKVIFVEFLSHQERIKVWRYREQQLQI